MTNVIFFLFLFTSSLACITITANVIVRVRGPPLSDGTPNILVVLPIAAMIVEEESVLHIFKDDSSTPLQTEGPFSASNERVGPLNINFNITELGANMVIAGQEIKLVLCPTSTSFETCDKSAADSVVISAIIDSNFEVEDQLLTTLPSGDYAVVAKNVISPGYGLVQIYNCDCDSCSTDPGSLIGATFVSPGLNDNVVISLEPSADALVTGTLFAKLAFDRGVIGTYDEEEDVLVSFGGNITTDQFVQEFDVYVESGEELDVNIFDYCALPEEEESKSIIFAPSFAFLVCSIMAIF